MAEYAGRKWTRSELLSFIGDPSQAAGARASVLTEGKAAGVRCVEVATGTGLSFTVLPGRGMDIPYASFKGVSLAFCTGTGITAPGYYAEPGLEWRRSFFGGLLTTCGISNAGAPSVDNGKPFGLHGRVANAAAEDVCVENAWNRDELEITIKGTMREVEAMEENLALTRRLQTRLGSMGFRITDVVENRGFREEPVMLLYHFNFGFPLLGPTARVVGPVRSTVPRDEEASRDRGVEEYLDFPPPVAGYQEKVFFHSLGADKRGNTFIALLNPEATAAGPLGIVLRWNKSELPAFTQWKMPRKGFYVMGLEPGTVSPLGRGRLRELGELPMLEAQESRSITIDFEVLDSVEKLKAVEEEAARTAQAG